MRLLRSAASGATPSEIAEPLAELIFILAPYIVSEAAAPLGTSAQAGGAHGSSGLESIVPSLLPGTSEAEAALFCRSVHTLLMATTCASAPLQRVLRGGRQRGAEGGRVGFTRMLRKESGPWRPLCAGTQTLKTRAARRSSSGRWSRAAGCASASCPD